MLTLTGGRGDGKRTRDARSSLDFEPRLAPVSSHLRSWCTCAVLMSMWSSSSATPLSSQHVPRPSTNRRVTSQPRSARYCRLAADLRATNVIRYRGEVYTGRWTALVIVGERRESSRRVTSIEVRFSSSLASCRSILTPDVVVVSQYVPEDDSEPNQRRRNSDSTTSPHDCIVLLLPLLGQYD